MKMLGVQDCASSGESRQSFGRHEWRPYEPFPRRVAIHGDLPNQIHEFQRHDELLSADSANLPTEVKMASSCGV